jgi:hypothetical protein
MASTATLAGKAQVRWTRTVTRFWNSRVDDAAAVMDWGQDFGERQRFVTTVSCAAALSHTPMS